MSAENQVVTLFLRSSAWAMVALVWLFLLNNFLIFWIDWPGILALFAHQGWLGLDPLPKPLLDEAITLGWFQIAICLGGLGAWLGCWEGSGVSHPAPACAGLCQP